jgi:hypothetical protein
MKYLGMIFGMWILAFGATVTATDVIKDPDCSGSGAWPTSMAFVHMKNAGIPNNDKLDFSKTKTVRLASEKIGKDLYHQVYLVTFTEKSGKKIEAIAVSDVSHTECSMSGVEVFVVLQHLNVEKM